MIMDHTGNTWTRIILTDYEVSMVRTYNIKYNRGTIYRYGSFSSDDLKKRET